MSESSSKPGPGLSQPEELVDRIIGEFRLLRRLGAGGMAEVYLAEQPSLERVVAIKLLRPDRVSGFEMSMVDRFEREAKAAAGLTHSNIVQVYQTGEDQGIHYIAQEYVQGSNLAEHVQKDGPPALDQGLAWMQQIGEALRAASAAGIVHRDIKPENIMLTRDLSAKVADFGLAQLSQSDQKNLTQTGTTMGTPLYMSPEQVRGSRVDSRSDQYSFGVTCYHMFAGRPPFTLGNSVAVAVQHLQDDPPPLAGHRADLPPRVCSTIHRMMEKNPDDRFQTCEEMVAAVGLLQDLSPNSTLQIRLERSRLLQGAIPDIRSLMAAVLVTVVAGVGAGALMSPSIELSDREPLLAEELDTPAAQYVAALQLPRSESSWLALREYHPESDEARYATLHLALLYAEREPPDNRRARQLLRELRTWLDTRSSEPSLRDLVLVASAMVADRQGNSQQAEEYLETIRRAHDELDEVVDASAPKVLQEYWETRRPPDRRGLPDQRGSAGPDLRGPAGPGSGRPDRRGPDPRNLLPVEDRRPRRRGLPPGDGPPEFDSSRPPGLREGDDDRSRRDDRLPENRGRRPLFGPGGPGRPGGGPRP